MLILGADENKRLQRVIEESETDREALRRQLQEGSKR
jgi:hypothetical protein